jgi:Planctomycete cytochrome C
MEFVYFLGRFHVLLLHIPITLALAVVVLDWLSRGEKHKQFAPVVPPLWAVTAISAVATAVLGYMHFSEGGFTGPSAVAHRALGTSVALLTTLVWAARSWSLPTYRRLQTAVSLALLALVTATGHFGGNLTHGDTYLVQYAPRALQRLLGFQVSRPPVKDIAAADPYLDIVRPIFEQRCFSCHNTGKQRGQLNLTTYDAVMKGGKDGGGHCSGQSERQRHVSADQSAGQ